MGNGTLGRGIELGRVRFGAAARLTIVAVALAAGAGRAGPSLAEEGNFFTNMLKYGGTTVPPSQPADRDLPYCPPVEVPEGGAAIRSYAGRADDSTRLRHQVTLGRVARECTRLQDGTLSVKVGVEGQVLLGPAGAPGRFEAPVSFSIKYGDKVVVTRARRVSVPVAAGEAQGLFSVVEDNLVVPAAMSQNFDIEVRLGAAPQRAVGPKVRKPPATSEERVATPAQDAAQ